MHEGLRPSPAIRGETIDHQKPEMVGIPKDCLFVDVLVSGAPNDGKAFQLGLPWNTNSDSDEFVSQLMANTNNLMLELYLLQCVLNLKAKIDPICVN